MPLTIEEQVAELVTSTNALTERVEGIVDTLDAAVAAAIAAVNAAAAAAVGGVKPYDTAFIAGFSGEMIAEDLIVQTYGEAVMGRAGSFTGEVGYIGTPAVGAAVIVDIEKNGVSIYTVLPQFAAAANVITAGTLKTDGTENFVAGDRITFKVTQIGTTTVGSGMRFTITAALA